MMHIPPLKKPPGYRDPGLPVTIRPLQPPPQRLQLPQSFYPEKRRRNHCWRCCCCFCIFFGLVTLLLICAIGFIYLWFIPKLPDIRIKSIEFTRLNVTSTPDGPVLDARSTVDVVVRNLNSQLKMVYDKSELNLNSEEGASIGVADLQGFVQGRKNVTVLKFALRSSQMILTDKQAHELKGGLRNKNLKISADIKTGIGTGYGGWMSSTPQVDVLCQATSLKQIEEGKAPSCNIRLLRWIYI